jgi:hypothetical protein
MSIFNIFRKDAETETETESEYETDSENEIEQVKEISLFDNSPLCRNSWQLPNFSYKIDVEYYLLSARQVVPYISSWSFNREINNDHKNSIKISLLDQTIPHLMGSIQIAKDKEGKCKVINGQHRLNAIQEIIKDDIDMKFDIQLMFEVYNLKNDNINDIENLFSLANSSLNFEKKDSVDSFCRDIILSLRGEKIYENSIVDTDKSVYRPCISMKQFYENLKMWLPKHLYEKKIEEVVHMIKNKNNQISQIDPNSLFKNPKKSETQYRKACEKRFYLNLSESRYDPEQWITELN